MPRIIELENPTYDQVYAAIGGYVQYVPDFHRYKGRSCSVFADEEGLLKQLPHNGEATRAWQDYLQQTMPDQWDEGMAQLCGDVVIAYGGMK
jgi:hypothetical protein